MISRLLQALTSVVLTTALVPASAFAQLPPRPPTPTPPAAPSTAPPALDFVSIVPSATRNDDQFPSAPPRTSTFYFKGKKGTSYVAVFSVPSNPALVVGVGANISSTSFDESSRLLTVNFVFDSSVLPPLGKPFPKDTFLIAIDPGAPRTFTPKPRPPSGKPPGREMLTSAVTECYGPLNQVPPSDDKPGPPLEAAGTFMSTNVAEWCVVPPNADAPFFGFQLRAGVAKTGYLKKKLAPKLVGLLSTLSGITISGNNTAIFSDDFEVSKSITPTDDGGLLINIKVSFDKNSTVVRPSASTSGVSAKATTSTKTITTSEEEDLSLAPKSTTVTRAKAALYGFVDDPTLLAGSTVLLQRQNGETLETVGTATVGSDGSYATKIKSAKLFKKSKASTSALKTVNLTATIIGDAIRSSRTITLTNRIRNSRR